jgi:hypothetical protein
MTQALPPLLSSLLPSLLPPPYRHKSTSPRRMSLVIKTLGHVAVEGLAAPAAALLGGVVLMTVYQAVALALVMREGRRKGGGERVCAGFAALLL